ncbi:MAG: AMP-binding protein, partial [Rhodothermales bacterium]|nr:AMP-binding protein [Rhodothermales bacterium]
RVLLGGSAIPKPLAKSAADLEWPVVLSYGMTETGSLVTATRPGAVDSSGTVLPGRKLRIAENGEIQVGGDVLFEGYLDGPSAGIWHATGDLGRLDEQGRLHVEARLDNMFVSGGENIHPEAVERALLELPGVESAMVVGVPDPEFGTRPVAFIRGEVSATDLEAGLREQLPAFMVPVAFLPLPAPGQGRIKPSRSTLMELARQARP